MVDFARIYSSRHKGGSKFYEEIAKRALELKDQLTMKSIFSLVKVLSEANYEKQNLYQNLSKIALNNYQDLSDHEFITLIIAFSTSPNNSFIERTKTSVKQRIDSYNVVDKLKLLKIYSLGKHKDEDMMIFISDAVKKVLKTASPNDFAHTCVFVGSNLYLTPYLKDEIMQALTSKKIEFPSVGSLLKALRGLHEMEEWKQALPLFASQVLQSINILLPNQLALVIYIYGIGDTENSEF